MKQRVFGALLFLTIVGSLCGNAQEIRVLHYTETSGFDHRTREVSLAMFQSYSDVLVTDDGDGSEFDVLDSLLRYDVVVFSNTSGSDLLNASQRLNFEEYIARGGNVLGIHAASDTYRHSSANGGSKGVWDFYAETLGGSVQQSPNHVRGTPLYDIFRVKGHPSVADIPDPWSKEEEYYYWENGYLDSQNMVVLEVETTVGPNGRMNSYDSSRAVSWYKELPSGSRVFYTSLGHARSNFTEDSLFQKHIEQALKWCSNISTNLEDLSLQSKLVIYPNPSSGDIYFEGMENDFSVDLD